MKAEVISPPNSTPKRPADQAVKSKEIIMSSGRDTKVNAIEKTAKPNNSSYEQSKSARPDMDVRVNKVDPTKRKDIPHCKSKENKENTNRDATQRENDSATSVTCNENTRFHYNLFDAYVERLGRETGNRKCLNDVTRSEPHSNASSSPVENGISSSSSTGGEPVATAIPLFDDKTLRNSLREASEMPSHILFIYPYRKQEDGGFLNAWCPPISRTKTRLPSEESARKLLSKQQQQQVHASPQQFPQPRLHRSLTMAPKEASHNVSVYDRLMSLGRYKEYGFQHRPEDTGWYIKEYTAHHTVGRIGHRNRKSHKLGVDIIDPYAQLSKKTRSPNTVETWQTQPPKGPQTDGGGEGETSRESKESARKDRADDGKPDKAKGFPVLAPVRENGPKKRSKKRSAKDGHKHGKTSSEPSLTSKERRENQAASLGDNTAVVGSHIDVATSAIFQDTAVAKTQGPAAKDPKAPAAPDQPSNSLAQGRENTFWENPVQDDETSKSRENQGSAGNGSEKHPDDSTTDKSSARSNVVLAMYKKSQKSAPQETGSDGHNVEQARVGSKGSASARAYPQISREHSTVIPPTPNPTPRENSTMKKHRLKTELETDKRSGRLMVKISVIDGGNMPSTDDWQNVITKKLTEAGHAAGAGDRQRNNVSCPNQTTTSSSARGDRKEDEGKMSKSSLRDCMSCENVFHEDTPDRHGNEKSGNRGRAEKSGEMNNERRKKKSQRSEVSLTKNEISADSTGLRCSTNGQERSATMRGIINPTGKKKHQKVFDKRSDNESELTLQLKSLEYDKRNSPVEDLKSSSGFNPNLSPILALTRQHTTYQQIDFDNPPNTFETPVFKYTKLVIPKEFSKHLMKGQFRNNSAETEPASTEDKRADFLMSYVKSCGGSLKLKNSQDSAKINVSEDDDCSDLSNGKVLHQSYPLEEWKKMVDGGQCGFIVKSFPIDKETVGKGADVGSSQSLFLQSRSELNNKFTGIVIGQTEVAQPSTAISEDLACKTGRDQIDPDCKRSRDVNNNESYKTLSLSQDATFLSPLTTHSFIKPALPSRSPKLGDNEVKARNSDKPLYRPSANLAFVKMDEEKRTSTSDNLTFYEILPSINNNIEPRMAKDDLFISGSNTTTNNNDTNGSRRKRPISLDRGTIDDLVRYPNETIPNGFRKHHASISNNSNSINNNNNNNHSSFHSQQQQQQQQQLITKKCDDTLLLAPYAFGLEKGCPDIAPQPESPHQTAKSLTNNEDNDTKRQMQIYAHVRKGICAERQATQILPSIRHILSFNHSP